MNSVLFIHGTKPRKGQVLRQTQSLPSRGYSLEGEEAVVLLPCDQGRLWETRKCGD